MPITPTRGELEKLTIRAYVAPDYTGSPVAEFRVFFNPEEYTQVYDVEYDGTQGQGTTGSPVVFRRIKPQEYTFKFFFDGTGTAGGKIDVYRRIKDFFSTVGYDGQIHRPRFLKLNWGTLESRCVLSKAEVTYKMFQPDGSPIRALLAATFTENIDDASRVARARDSSPDLTHIKTVKEGDTLPLLVYDVYKDISYYPAVAAFNELDSFRDLIPGMRLVFPPLAKD